MRPFRNSPRPSSTLARVLSKQGFCSRSEAFGLIRSGQVRVNGKVVSDPKFVVEAQARINVSGRSAEQTRVYVMLNKPRGLVTTTADEHGRETVFACLKGPSLPRLIAVGRLDQASEGLLLFTNDTAWADALTDPASHIDKTYHVQIDTVADETLLRRLREGIVSGGQQLRVKFVRVLRAGEKNSWLEIVLDEGRNRHIRRMLEAVEAEVLRLIRVSIGPLQLGSLAKGAWRHLKSDEVKMLERCRSRGSE